MTELDETYRKLRMLRDEIDRVLQHEPNRSAGTYSFNASGVSTLFWWALTTDNVTFTYYPRMTTAGKR